MNTPGTATILRADARRLPLADGSVDLICTSPPYWAQRSYTDGGQHYDGQIGAEPTPAEYVDSLIACTREWMRVLKPGGSIWVNLGDKYNGSGGTAGHSGANGAGQRLARRSNQQAMATPVKSLLGLPWRYAIRCTDDLGLILRRDQIWSKTNGMPESVTDRTRSSHEYWFHLVKQPRYFAAVDEIREAHAPTSIARAGRSRFAPDLSQLGVGQPNTLNPAQACNPLGKLPGSVWEIPTEPLKVPDHIAHARCCNGRKREGCTDGVDHYAAFPSEWPRRIILGWSPAGICTACGEGRRPAIASVGLDMNRPQARRAQALADRAGLTEEHFAALLSVGVSDTGRGAATQNGTGKNTAEVYVLADEARSALRGYAREYLLRRPTGFRDVCACPDTSAPTRPAVVLDPFSGTGTTSLVAKALGRHGIGSDRSADYCRLATWRTTDPGELAKAMRVPKPPKPLDGQGDLFADLLGGDAA